MKTISQTARRARKPADGVALGPFLEACVASGASLLVEADRGGELVGLVEVREGVVWRCLHFDHEGDRALEELLEEPLEQVVIRRGSPAHGPRNVFAAFPETAPPPGNGPGSFETHWDDGVSALLRRDFERAARAFRDAGRARPEDPSVRANLTRLREMGFRAES